MSINDSEATVVEKKLIVKSFSVLGIVRKRGLVAVLFIYSIRKLIISYYSSTLLRITTSDKQYSPNASALGEYCLCGERGIRTLEELSPLMVFKTTAFNHSAISPFIFNYSNECCSLVTDTTKKVVKCTQGHDTIYFMEQSARAITWEAPEHHHVEKSSDWFLALAIIVFALVISAILFGNTLFAILLAVAGITLAIMASKKPSVIPFAVTVRGITISDEMYPYSTLVSYHIDEQDIRGPQLLVLTKRHFMPLLILPLPAEYIDDIEDILKEKLSEDLLEEPLFMKILESFGF